jgi:hypothetical protein
LDSADLFNGGMEQEHTNRLVVLIPVFNDWNAIALLLPALDHAFENCRSRRAPDPWIERHFGLQRIVSTRLLVLALSSIAVLAGAAATAVAMHLAVPGWAGYAAAVLLILLTQALFGAFLLVFTTISARANMNFIPLRDAHHFIDRQERVFPIDSLPIRRLRAGNL